MSNCPFTKKPCNELKNCSITEIINKKEEQFYCCKLCALEYAVTPETKDEVHEMLKKNDEEIVKKQKLEEEPKVKRITDIILSQEKYKHLRGIEYYVKWKDIFNLDEGTLADIRLKNAQADAIEIDKAIASPIQLSKIRYPQDDYDFSNSENANFASGETNE